MSDEKLYFVTEVGVFEEIDIDDPTAVERYRMCSEDQLYQHELRLSQISHSAGF